METRHGDFAVRSRRLPWLRACLALTAAGCLGTSDDVATTDLEAVKADEIVYGVSLYMSKDGIREAQLLADSMFMWRDSVYSRIDGLTLVVFDEAGRRRATITADAGRLSQTGNELTAWGNAVLRIPGDDIEVRTEELNFAPEADRIWTEVPVVMREGTCEVEGDRFQADMSFDDLRIWGTSEKECAPR